ncbi:MAG TPA: hypothetical protein VET46_04105 [Steroidobacteraceae bacterium]|nr:hypothetical protein [Steroidobacteraceae bacterium]
MDAINKILCAGLLLVGGSILLLQTLFGLFVSLIFDFYTVAGWMFALGLTLAFPVYLLGLMSLRVATWCLWGFFAFQWANQCFLTAEKPTLVNPFDWWHGDALFAAIVMVNVAYVVLSRTSARGRSVRLGEL